MMTFNRIVLMSVSAGLSVICWYEAFDALKQKRKGKAISFGAMGLVLAAVIVICWPRI